jgi:hypothetical protein
VTSRAALTVALLCAGPAIAGAQLVPNERWYTIETEHFRVHFAKPLEAEGRRGAVNAELAWLELSTELKRPQGKVDLVIADNFDYVNGYATPFPGNRIVVFAHPPTDAPELRNYDDWSRLVITHELTHIFHLDRADGLWRIGRHVFGRHPALFPNQYQPAWLVEGLAVYYESRITGAGRLEGSEHYMLARAAAEAREVPRLGELSRATSRFPGGETVYAYGGLVLDYLSRTRGPEKIPAFVDATSRLIWPLSLNARAKKAFGISFENAWRDWRDSLVRASGAHTSPLRGWRQLTQEGRYVVSPRWSGDTAILYSAATGREVTSLYAVALSGKVTRLGRRNGLDVNVPRADGSIVYAQPDYTDAFHYRNDLYVERDGRQTRLTRGARLSQPDIRADGEIVAVQSVPGTTVLVRVSSDGRKIVSLTPPSADVQWTEPRWSPDGTSIAAIRIPRGGTSELVLLGESGSSTARALVAEAAIISSPSWTSAGDRVLYTSTRSGETQAYAVLVQSPDSVTRLTSSSTGFFNPESSPDSRSLAGLEFRFDGYHVGTAPALPRAQAHASGAAATPRAFCDNCRLRLEIAPPLTIDAVPRPHRYSPWRSLAPTYWEPLFTRSTGNGDTFGAATSGTDVIGRHSFYAEALYNTQYRQTEGYTAYQYAGLGQPFLNFRVSQEWEHFGLYTSEGTRVGDLARRARTETVSASFSRPRVRTFASFSVGAELESRTYGTQPDTLLSQLPAAFAATRWYPSLFTSASWSNAKRPSLSISREDGMSVSATARQRWQTGAAGSASRSVIGVAALYKSLDLPGFAHHVIAVRGAAGYADDRAISSFSVGGLSGGTLDVIAGFAIGGERRTFGVRGFPPSAEQGIRALGATAEYRAPIAAPSARVPFIPLLFDRISFSAFSDAGRAFCPASAGETDACRIPSGDSPWLVSAGGEVDFDTAIQYDVPARFRLGVAVPVVNREAGRAQSASLYFTLGASF